MAATADDRIAGISSSVAVKAPVHAVATSNITLSGLQTISGVALDGSTLYRVLVTAQTDNTQNGIYDAVTGSWSRSADFDGNRDVVQGTRVLVALPGASSAQEYELTSANPVTFGSSAITFVLRYGANATYDRTAAEVTALVTPTNYSYPEGHLYRYGTNTTPGTTDMLSAWNAAISLIGRAVFIPADTILLSANPNVPKCAVIGGAGQFVSILKCATGVTLGLSVTPNAGNQVRWLHDFCMQGNATTNARGIVFGNGSTASTIAHENLLVTGFTGTGAVGVDIRDAVKIVGTNLSCTGNSINYRCKAGTGNPSLPTTIWLRGGVLNNSTIGPGAQIIDGSAVLFTSVDFESNAQEGLSVVPGAGSTCADILVDGDCWFEGNYGSNTAQYQCVVDGSAAACTARVDIAKAFFNGSAGTAKSIRLTGAGVRATVGKAVMPNLASTMKVDTNAVANFYDWSPNFDFYTQVDFSDATTSVSGALPSAMKFYKTQSSSSDPNTLDDYDKHTAANTACTGALTASVIWKLVKIGSQVTLTIPPVTGTASATTNFVFGVVLPAKYRPAADIIDPAVVQDNGSILSATGCIYITASSGLMQIYKDLPRSGNFTAAAGAGIPGGKTLSWVV